MRKLQSSFSRDRIHLIQFARFCRVHLRPGQWRHNREVRRIVIVVSSFNYAKISFCRSKLPLALNQWHTIKISRTARLAVMKVDAQPEVMTVSPNGFWHLSLPYSLYLGKYCHESLANWVNSEIVLGGISKTNWLPSNLRDRGFFVGCVKEVN